MKHLIFAVAGLSLLSVTAYCVPARAHSWYSSYCCTGKDCVEANAGTVIPSKGGWRVIVKPGQHPMAPNGFEELVPYDDKRIQPSQDDNFHICILPKVDTAYTKLPVRLRCLYIGKLQG